jgi:hypothetical protein
LKLKFGEPLSNFAFNFNLRRYSTEQRELSAQYPLSCFSAGKGRAVQVDSIKTRVESAPGFSA